MNHVRLADIDSRHGPADRKRSLTSPLGTEHLAINHYELAPGDSFAFGYHRHDDQEEVFYVIAGTVTFETEDGPVDIGPEEAVRFPPGEYQRGVNDGSERVIALALGAPRDGETSDVRRGCPDCGTRTSQSIHGAADGDGLVTACDVCDTVTGRFLRGEVEP